ncbi:MAG: AraC family transcriptional regulator ligand-binding domain-containing protein, partial [Bacteroidota bacterium]
MQFHGRFILNLAQFAALQGGDPKSLVAASTKTYSELSEESCLIDAEAYEAIIQAALRETGDPLFGLHAGAQMNLQAAGLNLQIAQSAATVKEALDYGCKFFQLGCQALPMQLHLEKDLYFLTFHPQPLWKENYSASFQQTLYGFMAFAIRQYHALTQHQFYPRAIQLSAKRPRTWPELERVLGASIQFQRERNALVFRESDLEKKIISQDYELLKILVQHAEAKLEKLPQLPAFKEKVKQGLIQLMQPGFPLQEEM